MKALVDKTKDLEKNYGKFRNGERIEAKRIGKDLVLLKYLYKCESLPIVWYFSFYRSDATADSSNWVLVAVRYDTELELLGLTAPAN